MSHIRSRVLNNLFGLLYRRFVFFHEFAGRALYGDAWHARRLWCMSGCAGDWRIIDVGAGEGRLIAEAEKRGLAIRAFDPSQQMRASGQRRGSLVEPGSASGLPVRSQTIDRLIVTYPGAWIFDGRTWNEFERVLAGNAEVWILLGGTYERGSLARLRSMLLHLAYGREIGPPVALPAAEERGMLVRAVDRRDQWGRGYYLIVTKRSGKG